ncbi:RNA polymerase Rpc34 [Saccharata proteae CBS 121410]|uniref:DNA-directed RNA polymerase III subunit RPC6 n=1 Tax=Saccharata proteae CBS 121410 TaxID=1314787 RepID=A0A9P4LXT9_9PEZI|nr:RNA polymerase Rpc34 [Saccharata proteae CBS 121410]
MPKREQLYERCAERDPGTIFFQEDLSLFNVAKDVEELLSLCQELVNLHLFELLESGQSAWDRALCWRLRTREDADKLRNMDNNERLIYSHIASTAEAGMWTRTIRAKTNFHQSVINKALKSLESKRLVKAIQSVKTPGRKIYMLAHLQPPEDVSGGPWHSEGELDVDLIETIATIIVQYVESRSWAEQRAPTKAEIARKKALVHKQGADREPPKYEPPIGVNGRLLVPYGPGYSGYPTMGEIKEFIVSSGVVTVVLRDSDMRDLLENLVFDGRLERMGAATYRTVRGIFNEVDEGYGNGFTQAPCGRCPVFSLCEEGGPVSATNCVYFDEWLKF